MELKNLYLEKYINYFNSKDLIEDKVLLNDFVSEMIAVCKEVNEPILPIKSLENICIKFSLPFKLESLVKLVNNENVKTLTDFEIFTLLWYFSCKNPMLFDYEFYLKMAKLGIIGTLISELKSRN